MGNEVNYFDKGVTIQGLTVSLLKRFSDERGAVLKFLQLDSPNFQGFGEAYFSLINESVVKFGYNFVFTPELNFFLYADPEIILKRKQELTKETIVELTNKYSSLFNQFEQRKRKNNYHLINNIDLESTKKHICRLIESKMK